MFEEQSRDWFWPQLDNLRKTVGECGPRDRLREETDSTVSLLSFRSLQLLWKARIWENKCRMLWGSEAWDEGETHSVTVSRNTNWVLSPVLTLTELATWFFTEFYKQTFGYFQLKPLLHLNLTMVTWTLQESQWSFYIYWFLVIFKSLCVCVHFCVCV